MATIHSINHGEVFIETYQDLFIYHLQGRVRDRDERLLGENFLGNWVEDNESFLFFSAPANEIISNLLKARSDLVFFDDYHFTYEQWQGAGLSPFKIENFLIVPPWDQTDAEKGELKIILDAGVVFGTGLHPTTRDCLRAMVYLRRRYPWNKVMDFGTGTGLLAIAAALLGSKDVLAIDLNPLSVKTAKKNVRLNQLESFIRVIEGRVEDFVNEDADLLLANIHFEVIRKILGNKGFRERPWFIISGLMRSQVQEVKWKMEKYDLQVIHEWDNDMTWYTILAQNGKLASLNQ